MDCWTEVIDEFLRTWWEATSRQIKAVSGQSIDMSIEQLRASEIGLMLVRIGKIADGQLKWSPEAAMQAQADIDAFMAFLTQSPYITLPDHFKSTPIGFMLAQAQSWVDKDDLLSIGEAAGKFNLSISSLSQLVTRHNLGYRDPRITNPRHARRVRESEVSELLSGRTG